jgi:hypothetical protein
MNSGNTAGLSGSANELRRVHPETSFSTKPQVVTPMNVPGQSWRVVWQRQTALPPLPTGPAPVEARFDNYKQPPHRPSCSPLAPCQWKPGLTTTNSYPHRASCSPLALCQWKRGLATTSAAVAISDAFACPRKRGTRHPGRKPIHEFTCPRLPWACRPLCVGRIRHQRT